MVTRVGVVIRVVFKESIAYFYLISYLKATFILKSRKIGLVMVVKFLI